MLVFNDQPTGTVISGREKRRIEKKKEEKEEIKKKKKKKRTFRERFNISRYLQTTRGVGSNN